MIDLGVQLRGRLPDAAGDRIFLAVEHAEQAILGGDAQAWHRGDRERVAKDQLCRETALGAALGIRLRAAAEAIGGEGLQRRRLVTHADAGIRIEQRASTQIVVVEGVDHRAIGLDRAAACDAGATQLGRVVAEIALEFEAQTIAQAVANAADHGFADISFGLGREDRRLHGIARQVVRTSASADVKTGDRLCDRGGRQSQDRGGQQSGSGHHWDILLDLATPLIGVGRRICGYSPASICQNLVARHPENQRIERPSRCVRGFLPRKC